MFKDSGNGAEHEQRSGSQLMPFQESAIELSRTFIGPICGYSEVFYRNYEHDSPFYLLPGEAEVSLRLSYTNEECSPWKIGIIDSKPLGTGRLLWGRPHLLEQCDNHAMDNDSWLQTCGRLGRKSGGGDYAMCAAEDGMMVRVCLAEKPDSLENAKRIFESFRWIKGNKPCPDLRIINESGSNL